MKRICVFCGSSSGNRPVYAEAAQSLADVLVKDAFEDPQLRDGLGLNSANSINIARLMAQVCYYFEAAAAVDDVRDLVLAVPSGNFGNVTAGLVAHRIGLPYKRIIAATNVNDTVPRFFDSGHWAPNPTVATITNGLLPPMVLVKVRVAEA